MSTTTNRFAPGPSAPPKSMAQKKSLNLPSSLSSDVFELFRNALIFFSRRVIFAPLGYKFIVYFLFIIIGSLLKELHLAPHTYLTSKRNIFNMYFAKLGWAWSMGLLIPFIYFTSLIYTRGDYRLIARHFVRLLVATGIWFVITTLFVYIEAFTGSCKHEDLRKAPRHVCLKGGHEWQEGHDFSGHTFLLLYALLIINDEIRPYDKLSKKFEPNAGSTAAAAGDSSGSLDERRIKMFSALIKTFYIALAILTVLWEFMLLSTALYFHNTRHKLVAAFLAIFFWFITYRIWYPMKNNNPSILAPCSPGDENFVTS